MSDDNAKWTAFSAEIAGKLLFKGQEGYDQARAVWNKAFDRYPYAITFPESKEEVAKILVFAKSVGRTVSVRCGGHSRSSVIDDAIVIDLSRNMKNVTVDPSLKIARVQGGAMLHDLDIATAPHKLVVPAGQVSHTGIGGLTLQGGMGYLCRKFGLSCDNVISYEVVTAAGEIITASKHSHQDLFWALKGAGHNFGVVTEFTFQLHDFPEFTSGTIIWPYETQRAREIFKLWHEVMVGAPDELSIYLIFATLPNMGKVIVLDASFVGDVPSCEKALAGILNYGAPIVKAIHPDDYVTKQQKTDAMTAYGQHNFYNKDLYYNWNEDLIDQFVALIDVTPLGAIVITLPLGGAVSRDFKANSAFSNRDAKYVIAPAVVYQEGGKEEVAKWVGKFKHEHIVGLYSSTEAVSHEEAALAFGGANLPRLREIKKKYDPENVFKHSFNIAV